MQPEDSQPTPRKIIQIIPALTKTLALCNDGTIWSFTMGERCWVPYHEFPNIVQEYRAA